MATVPPRPTHPPVSPDATRGAQAKLVVLRAELAQERKKDRRAVLQYEVGAVFERDLRDDPSAVNEYLAAYNTDPSFRPPLFALVRIFERRRSYKNLARLYESEATSARSKKDLSDALLDRAALLEDRLGQPLDARGTLSQALAEYPDSRTGSLYLELAGRMQGDESTVRKALDHRLRQCADPTMRVLLLTEVAMLEEQNGDADRAMALLTEAAHLGVVQWRTWERLERVARKHGRLASVIAALEGRAFIAMSVFRGHGDEHDPYSNDRFGSPALAAKEAAALWYEAGRLREGMGDAPGAMTCFSHAVECDGDDALFRLSQMSLATRSDELEQGANAARAVLERGGTGKWASAFYGQLARFLVADGKTDGALVAIRAALEEDPGSAAAAAILDGVLTDHERHAERLRFLVAKGATGSNSDRARTLWQAADLASYVLRDFDRAKTLYTSAIALADDPVAVRRELYEAAVFHQRPDVARDAARGLLTDAIDDDERSALLYELYAAGKQHSLDPSTLDGFVREALPRAESALWAPMAARLRGARDSNLALWAKGHEALAEFTKDETLATAHLAAAARVHVRAGDLDAARALLERALSLSPGHAYATALLEEVLRRKGEPEEVVRLLRASAESIAGEKIAERNLLSAGASAEQGGNTDLAAELYEQVRDLHPDNYAAPWFLKRLGERTRRPDLVQRATAAFSQIELAQGAEDAGMGTLALAERQWFVAQDSAAAAQTLASAVESKAVGTHAALWTLLLGRDQTTTAARVGAATRLCEVASAADKSSALRQLAVEASRDPAFAKEHDHANDARRERDAMDPSLAMESLLGAQDDGGADMVDAWIHLASTADANAAPGLALAALRAHRLHAPGTELPAALQRAVDDAQKRGTDADALAVLRFELRGKTPPTHTTTGGADALGNLRRAVARNPNDFASWDALRVAALRQSAWGDAVRASDALAQAAEGSTRAELLEHAGVILLDHLNDAAAAEQRLRDALRVDPSRAVAYARLRDLLVANAKTPDLLQLVSRRIAVVDDPTVLESLYYEQARLFRATGNREGALTALDNLALFAPDHMGAMALRVETLVSLERWAEAIEALRTIAKGDVPVSQKRLARIGAADFLDKKIGDPQGAIRELSELVALGTDDTGIHERMAVIAERAGSHGQALEYLARAAQLTTGRNRARIERWMGDIQLDRLSNRDAARIAYGRALAAYPSDVDSARRLVTMDGEHGESRAVIARFAQEVSTEVAAHPMGVDALGRYLEIARWREDRTLTRHLQQLLVIAQPPDGSKEGRRSSAPPPASARGLVRDDVLFAVRTAHDPRALCELSVAMQDVWLAMDRWTVDVLLGGQGGAIAPKANHDARADIMAICEQLGVPVGEFYQGGHDPTRIALVPGPKKGRATWVLGDDVTGPLNASRRFFVGQLCAAFRFGTLPIVQRTVDDAHRLLVATAHAASVNWKSSETVAPALTDAIRQRLPRKLRKTVADAVMETKDADPRLWCEAASAEALMVGAAMAQSVDVALRSVLQSDPTADAVRVSSLARRMAAAWASPEVLALSRTLGTP